MSDIKKILIIEDDISLSEGIVLAFKDIEFTFVRAKNLAEARQNIKSIQFDLIILDINLPDGNGLDFLKCLRKSSAIPIIILTANDMETDVVRGLELGADDYITKPFSLMILRRVENSGENRESAAVISGDRRLSVCYSIKWSFPKTVFLVVLSKTEQKLLVLYLKQRPNFDKGSLVDSI